MARKYRSVVVGPPAPSSRRPAPTGT